MAAHGKRWGRCNSARSVSGRATFARFIDPLDSLPLALPAPQSALSEHGISANA